MVNQENGVVRRITTISTLIAIGITALVQFAGLLIWGSRIDYRMDSIETGHLDLHREFDRLNDRGSRNFPLIEQRLKAVEALYSSNMVRLETVLQQHSAHTKEIERIVDQQRRIIEALDNVYNRTNELSNKMGELEGRAKIVIDHLRQSPRP